MDDTPARWPIHLHDPPPLGWMNTAAALIALFGLLAFWGMTGLSGGGGASFGSGEITVEGVLSALVFGTIYGLMYGVFRVIRGSTRAGDAVVGADGILCVDRFVGWDAVERVDFAARELTLRGDGTKTRFRTDAAEEVISAIEARRKVFESKPAAEVPRQLRPSRPESYIERIDRLQDLKSTGYRELGLRPESLLDVLSDPRASDDDRSAAAIVLSTAPAAMQERARRNIATLANADLQYTLLAALGDEPPPKVRVAEGEPEGEPEVEPAHAPPADKLRGA